MAGAALPVRCVVRRRLFAWAVSWLLLAGFLPAAQAGLRIELEQGLSAGDERAARELVDAVLWRLPPRWREEETVLRLGWRDDLPSGVHGRIRGGRIGLSRTLLDRAAAWPSDEAVAALVHELAHARDRTHGLSRDPRLLDLAGWQVRPLWPGRSGRNAFASRSPDVYELHSPAEFVAVNLEHYLLDPDYACRRPALHAWFAEHFGQAPGAPACGSALPFVDAGALSDAAAAPLLELDPARVAGVDYLLAGEGDAVMSRWGHGMLRLVVCAPGRSPGPDCRLDLDHHRVLSFRAFVDDLQLSNWRGLAGGYPSRLFVLPLQQVVDEYTRVEMRPLESIPLRLSPDEIGALLERAARVHWSYDGRYRFIDNNCAVETWKLLHDGLPRAAAARLDSITPRGLLRRLRRAGLVDAAALPADPGEALRLGFRFEPWSAHYQALYETARADLGLAYGDVEDWLRLPPAQRAPWLRRGDLRASAALLLLEEAALRREEQRARDMLKRLLFRPGDPLLPMFAEARRDGAAFASPSSLLPLPGYGLPLADERGQARAGAGEHAARTRALHRRLQAAARDRLPRATRDSLEQAEANVAALGAHLRELHEARGGLRSRSAGAATVL
ncbi:DUF4105 domain-containing protein [Luteimonas granuli]|uniref:DUF4105 domain-containing protein n=1 Tax=Luteimonas granuli TaxID=1176533 RepID=A0A518N7R9_9GAMM|nr:DUF4105 domain-containing protein [Luteimonas granuli]QDW67959.1 DUF4105 domain-containing protein [Luteimonas granuli]